MEETKFIPIHISHFIQLFKLRNDLQSRKLFNNTRKTNLIKHSLWMLQFKLRKNQLGFVIINKNNFVGVIYANVLREKSEAILSINIDKNYRNKGFGKLSLKFLIQYLLESNFKHLYAQILNSNEYSKKLLLNQNFKLYKKDKLFNKMK